MLASNLVPRASFCFFKIDKNTKLLSTREALGTRLIKIECFYHFLVKCYLGLELNSEINYL